MNSFDLLNKLNLPSKIGLEGDSALFSKKTIMDAYLSAASFDFNRQMFVNESLGCSGINEGASGTDTMFSLNQISADLPKASNIDLFRMIGSEGSYADGSEENSATKIVVDLLKIKDLEFNSMEGPGTMFPQMKESPESLDLVETEQGSLDRVVPENKRVAKAASQKAKKKLDADEINQLINEERRRLLKKLDSCTDDRVVFKRRVKNSKKSPKVKADNYRGSKYWGVSKNKSKWQVSDRKFHSIHRL